MSRESSLLNALSKLEESFSSSLFDGGGIYKLPDSNDIVITRSEYFEVSTSSSLMGGLLSHYLFINIRKDLKLVITYGEDISIKARPVVGVTILNTHLKDGNNIIPIWKIDDSYYDIVIDAILNLTNSNLSRRL